MKSLWSFITQHTVRSAIVIVFICSIVCSAQVTEIKWKPLGRAGLAGAHVLEFTQQRKGDMFMLTQQTVYRSSDGGSTWKQAGAGLPYGKGTMFAIAAHASGKLFVGADDGMYSSIDSAKTWQRVQSTLIGKTRVRRFFMDTLGIIVASTYSQMFRSLDTGKTWHEIGDKIPMKHRNGYPQLCYSWDKGWEVLYGTSPLCSKDLGMTWTYSYPKGDTGYPTIPPEYKYRSQNYDVASGTKIEFTRDEPYTYDMLEPTLKDFYNSREINFWTKVPPIQFYSWNFYWGRTQDTVEIVETLLGAIFTGSDTVLIGSHAYGIFKFCPLWKCNNTSVTSNTGLGNLSVTTLFQADNGRIYCGTRGGGPYYSTNKGSSWNEGIEGLYEPSVFSLLLPDAKNPKTFVAGTGAGVFVSTDSGATWQRRVNGLGAYFIITLERTPKGTILAGTLNGAYRSTDNGLNWTFIKTSPKPTPKYIPCADYAPVNDFVCLKNGWIVLSPYLGSGGIEISNNNVYISKDDGITWSMPAPVSNHAQLTKLELDTATGNLIVLFKNAVKVSRDTGKTWTMYYTWENIGDNIEQDLRDRSIHTTMYLKGKKIYVATNEDVRLFDTTNGMPFFIPFNGNRTVSKYFKNSYSITSILSDPLDNMILGTMRHGLYFSNDEGQTYTQENKGLAEPNILNLVQDNRYHLYALTANTGIYVTERPTAVLATTMITTPMQDTTNVSVGTLSVDWKTIPKALRYQVQVSRSPLFNVRVVDDSNVISPRRVVQILDGETYYVRVRGIRGPLRSDWSSVRKIEAQSVRPAVPELMYPPFDTTINQKDVSLQWSSAARATRFRLELAGDTNFTSAVMVQQGLQNTGYAITVEPTREYYWRVRAENADGNSAWSDVWHFSTGTLTTVDDDGSTEKQQSIRIIPNPIRDWLEVHISPHSELRSISITNVRGEEEYRGTSAHINTATLSNGVYVVSVVLHGTNIPHRFLVQVMR